MQSGRWQGYATISALIGIVGLLGLTLVQLDHVQEQLVVQSQQLRALGEATDRLAASGLRTRAEPGAASERTPEPEPAKVLHPEVPNFLKPDDMHWPAPGLPLDGTLVRGWPSGDPKGFNPLLENGADVGEDILTYASLSLASRNGWTNPDEWHGELATRVEITDDFKEFTIYLRRGVKWHPAANLDLDNPRYAWLRGNHEVTAKDIVFTFDMTVNPQVENGFAKSYYSEFESCKAVDDYTVVVRWKKKQYLNLETTLSTSPVPEFIFAHNEDGSPIPKETLGLRFNQHWYNNKGYVGSGPFRMTTYEPGARIRLLRNEDFYGDKPAIKEIDYPIYTDPNQTILKLKAHEITDSLLTAGQYREEIYGPKSTGNPPKNSPFFDGRIQWKLIDNPAFSYIGWNADRPLFSDKRVRRAMTMALNRKQLIDTVYVGLGQVATGPFLPSSPDNDPSISPIPFDLEGAKRLLAEAGWSDTDGDGLLDKELRPGDKKRTPFEFTLLIFSGSKEFTTISNVYKDDLLKIGVKMNIDAAEWSLLQKRMDEKHFDAYAGAWGLAWTTDLFQIWHSSQADVPKGSNRIGFRNKAADAIIEKLRVSFDPAERVALAHQFHHLVDEEQPYTFFMVRKAVYCWWNDVKGVVFAKVRPIPNALPWAVAKGAR